MRPSRPRHSPPCRRTRHGPRIELKIGVVAAESGSFVSAGNTIVAAAKLATQQINDAGGIKIGNRDLQNKTLHSRQSHRCERDDRGRSRVGRRYRRQSDLGQKNHDFSVSMAKITGAEKVIQFSGNSSLGAVLDDKSVAPGGWLHYTFQSEPQEWQRSGSTAKGVLALLTPLLAHPPKHSVVFVGNDATGQYLSSHYVKALEAEGQQVDLVKYPPDTRTSRRF